MKPKHNLCLALVLSAAIVVAQAMRRDWRAARARRRAVLRSGAVTSTSTNLGADFMMR